MTIELKEVMELIKVFEKSSMNTLEIGDGGFFLKLEKGLSCEQNVKPIKNSNAVAKVFTHDEELDEEPENDNVKVKSPIVGTFYEAPSPGAKPFVTVGQKVSAGDVLCVVEAMKLINEIKSPVDGVVAKINVSNGQLMSYGDVIMELSNV